MNTDDEHKITKLVTDYMCWWDRRSQNIDFLSQVDENVTVTHKLLKRDGCTLINEYKGKDALIAFNGPDVDCVHSTGNYVFKAIDANNAEVSAYFRAYFRKGNLLAHGEDSFRVQKIDGEWKMMSIVIGHYWFPNKKFYWLYRLTRIEIFAGALFALLVGGIAIKIFGL